MVVCCAAGALGGLHSRKALVRLPFNSEHGSR